MTKHESVAVTLPADVQQIDQTGYVWAFLDDVAEPDRVQTGALIVAGDAVEPFLARVVDLVPGPNGRTIVHLLRNRSRDPLRGSAPGRGLVGV